MDSLNQIELQNLRHICMHSQAFCEKIEYFKTLTEDQSILDLYNNICGECSSVKTQLEQIL